MSVTNAASRHRWTAAVPLALLLASASAVLAKAAIPRRAAESPQVMTALEHINRETAGIMVTLNGEVALRPGPGAAAPREYRDARRRRAELVGPIRVMRAAVEDYTVVTGDGERGREASVIADRLERAVSKAYAAQALRIAYMSSAEPGSRGAFFRKREDASRYVEASLDLERAVREADRAGVAMGRWIEGRLSE